LTNDQVVEAAPQLSVEEEKARLKRRLAAINFGFRGKSGVRRPARRILPNGKVLKFRKIPALPCRIILLP
jgi:hypothetical protein